MPFVYIVVCIVLGLIVLGLLGILVCCRYSSGSRNTERELIIDDQSATGDTIVTISGDSFRPNYLNYLWDSLEAEEGQRRLPAQYGGFDLLLENSSHRPPTPRNVNFIWALVEGQSGEEELVDARRISLDLQIVVKRERQETYILRKEEMLAKHRDIQNELEREPPPDYRLLISVDATPKRIAGYCVDFVKKICHCYTYKSSVLPWALNDKSITGDSAEFEMKNLMFALLLWQKLIQGSGSIQIYTDNWAITKPHQERYGGRAAAFLAHFKTCHGITMNTHRHVNSNRHPRNFAKFIVPADDLSRFEIEKCETFLRKIYEIHEIQNTHVRIQTVICLYISNGNK